MSILQISLKFISESFMSPGSFASWLILLSIFGLIGFVPVVVLFIKNKWGYFSALGLALIPLLIGILGTIRSFVRVYNVIGNVPESMREQALATGKSVALTTTYFGIIPTFFFWLIAVACFAIVTINNQSTGSIRESAKPYPIDAKTRLLILYLSGLIIPVLFGCMGWLLGTILNYDAIACVPAAERESALSYGQSIINRSVGVSIFLIVACIIFVLFQLRNKSNSETDSNDAP